MKVYRSKLGTMPAMLQFRHGYKFQPGLRVIYRRVVLVPRSKHWQPIERWETGVVRQTEPILFIDRF